METLRSARGGARAFRGLSASTCDQCRCEFRRLIGWAFRARVVDHDEGEVEEGDVAGLKEPAPPVARVMTGDSFASEVS